MTLDIVNYISGEIPVGNSSQASNCTEFIECKDCDFKGKYHYWAKFNTFNWVNRS